MNYEDKIRQIMEILVSRRPRDFKIKDGNLIGYRDEILLNRSGEIFNISCDILNKDRLEYFLSTVENSYGLDFPYSDAMNIIRIFDDCPIKEE